MVSVAFIVLTLGFGIGKPSIAFSPTAPPPTLQQTAQMYASQYDVSFPLMNCVITAESKWNPLAVGDHGLANNIVQFHKATFDRWSGEMGESLNYNSSSDQLLVMSYAFSKGKSYEDAWSTFSTCEKSIYGKV